MLNERTVFVLGAGASYELNMPLGSNLVEEISLRLSHFGKESGRGREEIRRLNICFDRLGNLPDFKQVAWEISTGVIGTASIDDYVETHQGKQHVSTIAKTLIAQIILEKERTSYVYSTIDDPKFSDHNKVASSWMMAFWRLLQRGIASDQVDRIFDSLRVINFNYDRCLEHFLSAMLQVTYHISKEKSLELVENLQIIHPYGSLGSLNPKHNNFLKFGQEIEGYELPNVAKGICTYSELTENKALQKNIIPGGVNYFPH